MRQPSRAAIHPQLQKIHLVLHRRLPIHPLPIQPLLIQLRQIQLRQTRATIYLAVEMHQLILRVTCSVVQTQLLPMRHQPMTCLVVALPTRCLLTPHQQLLLMQPPLAAIPLVHLPMQHLQLAVA